MTHDDEFEHQVFPHGNERFPGIHWRPGADLYRTRTGWLAKVDLAGVDPRDVEVRVVGNVLRVSGRRRDALAEQDLEHYHMEISYGAFERVLDLPGLSARYAITREFKRGMLLIGLRMERAP